ncbi:MAG TPA: type II toxin-antitoxin system VapC family toxin [Urbifossiella sp.]
MLYMLDTNVLSEHMKGNPKIARRGNDIEPGDAIAVSNIAWFEIIRGRIAALTTADDMNQLLIAQMRLNQDLEKLERLKVYGVTESVAAHFDSLRANKKCKKMDRPDLLIACITLANNATLVTRNVKDFSNIPSLKIQNWFN